VGLSWTLDSLTLAPSRRATVATQSSRGEVRLGSTSSPVQVRRFKGGWEMAWRKDGTTDLVTSLWPRDTLFVGPERATEKGAAGAPIQWAGKSWRGRLKVFVNPRGRLTLATRLPLEDYLLGVVPAEIGGLGEDLLEAGRAQAIAARSYTLYYMGRRGSEGFDLFGTVEDQAYGGIEAERPLATRCVETTRGQVQMWKGQPVRANYSSTCGGMSAEAWEAWPPEPFPYLTSHSDRGKGRDYCETSPHPRWREVGSAESFRAEVSKFGPPEGVPLPADGVGEIVDVRVDSRSRSGRVWRLVVETTTGDIVIPAHVIRRVLRRPDSPDAILRSNLFKIGVRRDPNSRRALAVIASGGGSGHGVGLCQTGAMGMARQGVPAERILDHYYPGADLRRLY